MRLSKIEISGFKSFANKTVLDFPAGFTAVVGPNGSGKSNIADAVEWVLGEQSFKSIRVKKSEDLIFAGSDNKTRLSRASVSLFLNGDENELDSDFIFDNLSRRVFRDGSGSSYINGKEARLKDVYEVIAKAKINSDFSVISQKRGDNVLDLSPRSRRLFMEQAIGIKEYRLKKDETIGKLHSTSENILKIRTVIAELKPKYNYLERECKKIDKKKSLENERYEIRKNLYQLKYAYLLSKKAQVENVLNDISLKINSLKSEIKNLDKKIKEQRANVNYNFNEGRLLDLLNKRNAILRDLGQKEGRLSVLKEEGNKIITTLVDKDFILENLIEIKKEAGDLLAKKEADSLQIFMDKISDLIELVKRGRIEKHTSADLKSLKELEDYIEKTNLELQNIEKEIQEEQTKQKESKTNWEKAKNAILNLESEYRGKTEELNGGKNRLESLKQSINADEINKIKNILVNEFHVPLDKIDMEADDRKIKNLEDRLYALQYEINSMGEVDESVYKEYSKLKENYEFLSKELEDLNKSSESLNELILKLNKEIGTEFTKNLDLIKKYFDEYFHFIFNGGRCFLEEIRLDQSQEGNDFGSLDTGLEINVSLPKKKMQNLHSFSGGERALVSIAFMLGLIKAGHPPFLVLDEMDSPLDENNSSKFGEMIKELSEKTQFIVITHNHQTMRWADILYGVSMNNEGISMLASLKLDK